MSERMTAQATHVNAALHHVLSQLVKQRLTGSEGAWRDYQAAAELLGKVRRLYDQLGESQTGQTEMAQLRAKYHTLRAFQEEMARAALD